MRIAAYVGGVGVLGPGLHNWTEAADVLSGRCAYQPAPTVLPVPALLPPAERRRTGRVVKTALAVALEATTQAGIEPAKLASVFASSGGDGHNCHEICRALTLEAREISPTRFANSVHNAAAGYWSIATGAKRASTVLCAFDASFCAGLLDALTQVAVDEESALLIAYDTEYPDPIAFQAADSGRLRCGIGAHAAVGKPDRWRASKQPSDSGPAMRCRMRSSSRCAPRFPPHGACPCCGNWRCMREGRTVLEYLDVSNIIVQVAPCT